MLRHLDLDANLKSLFHFNFLFMLSWFTEVAIAEISSSVQGKGGGPPHQAKCTS